MAIAPKAQQANKGLSPLQEIYEVPTLLPAMVVASVSGAASLLFFTGMALSLSTPMAVSIVLLLMSVLHLAISIVYILAWRKMPNPLIRVRLTCGACLVVALAIATYTGTQWSKPLLNDAGIPLPEVVASFTTPTLCFIILGFPVLSLGITWHPKLRDYLNVINLYDGELS